MGLDGDASGTEMDGTGAHWPVQVGLGKARRWSLRRERVDLDVWTGAGLDGGQACDV